MSGITGEYNVGVYPENNILTPHKCNNSEWYPGFEKDPAVLGMQMCRDLRVIKVAHVA